MSNTEHLIGLGAMATRVGVPRDWLRSEADSGRVPHLRAGARYLFSAQAVERLLLARAKGEAPDAPDQGLVGSPEESQEPERDGGQP